MTGCQEVIIKIMAILSFLLSSLGLASRTPENPPPTSPPPSPAATETPRPSADAPGYSIDVGTASYVVAEYGDDYLALPHSPRGTLVRICGKAGCVERRSTDVGPVKRLRRVADLSARDFVTVSGTPLSRGLCVVTVEFLDE